MATFRDQTEHIGDAVISLLEERGPIVGEKLRNLTIGRAFRMMGEEMVDGAQYDQTLQALLTNGQIQPTDVELQIPLAPHLIQSTGKTYKVGSMPGYRLNPDYIPSE